MSIQCEACLNYVVALGIRVDFNGPKKPSIYDNDLGITIFMSTCSTKDGGMTIFWSALNPKMTLELLYGTQKE